MQSPGIEIRPIRQMNGGSGFNDVFFSGVRVPDENRLGAVDGGWQVAITTLMNERAAIGARGMAGFGPMDLVRLAREAHGPRGKAIDDSAVRARIADFHVRSAGLAYTTYRTLTALSRGETPGPENSIHKLVGSPLRQQMAAFGVELQGQAGTVMDPEYGAQSAWLASPGMRLAGGTDEIMRNIIAERVLGLPAEPRVDKDQPFSATRRNRA